MKRLFAFFTMMLAAQMHFQSASAAESSTAVEFVQSLYLPGAAPGLSARYTPKLDALWDKCRAREQRTGRPCMGAAMFTRGAGLDITDVAATQLMGRRAPIVRVDFLSAGKPQIVLFDLAHAPDGWRIVEIRGLDPACSTLSGLLEGRKFKC